MKKHWIVIANSVAATIYEVQHQTNEKSQLVQHKQLTHADSQKKRSELIANNSGHTNSPGLARGTQLCHADPHKVTKSNFARELAKFLKHELVQAHYERISLYAEPEFYGLLINKLDKQVQQTLYHVVQKEYVNLTHQELQQIILSDLRAS